MGIAPEILGKLKTITQYEVWHTMDTNSDGGDSFPVQLLVQAIERKDAEYEPYWGAWSAMNPKLATVLWPIIQSMAIENLYHEIPETLRFAEGYQGPESGFEKALWMQIHSNLDKRQSLYSSGDLETGYFDRDSEGLPSWKKVQDWLNANPVPR
jgi:hypothetical protein